MKLKKRKWGFFEADISLLSPEHQLSGLRVIKSMLGDKNPELSNFLKIDLSILKLEAKKNTKVK